ncbi:hypothetical protein PBRA_001232 [Plasmodiophora brassicae]|nr:hypothetical protein PBRA_001232 [Plasmodiophora brassicae]
MTDASFQVLHQVRQHAVNSEIRQVPSDAVGGGDSQAFLGRYPQLRVQHPTFNVEEKNYGHQHDDVDDTGPASRCVSYLYTIQRFCCPCCPI